MPYTLQEIKPKSNIKDSYKNALIKSTGLLVFLCLLEIAPRVGLVDKQFIPSLSTALGELIRLGIRGDLTMHIMVSLWRVIAGLLLGCAIAILAGVLIEIQYPFLSEILNPMLRLLSGLNPFSLGPIFIMFFGVGELVKVSHCSGQLSQLGFIPRFSLQ